MNTEIIFEEEQVKEEVYRGTFVIDQRLTPKQQRRKIFNMMKQDGIKVENESEYDIGYEGVSDNDGISETQETAFVVTRTYMKKIPYKVTRDEIYSGTYILDGLRITPEEQRKKIFDLLRDEGYAIENEDDYEIGYSGADDNFGISETQVTNFTVFKVKKERLDDSEYAALEADDSRKIQGLYDEMISLKDEIKSTDGEDLGRLEERVNDVTDKVDNIVEQTIKDYGSFEQEIERLTKKIKETEERIKESVAAYEESFQRMKELAEEEREAEEDKKDEINRRKELENERSLSIRKDIDRQKRELSTLKGKRTKVKNDLETARVLGLSASEYNDLVSNLRKKGILDAIFEKKGLQDIISIPSKERTLAQRKVLQETKKEIMEELAKLQKENKSASVLDNIEALYGIELQKVRTNGRERILIVKPDSFQNMVVRSRELPEKIIKTNPTKVDYTPGKAPEDLKDVFETRTSANIPESEVPEEQHEEEKTEQVEETNNDDIILNEKYTIFRSIDNQEKLYVRKAALERFRLEPIGEEVRIDGAACYEINVQDANSIRAHANNNYSPYIVDEKYAKVIIPEKQQSRGLTDKVTIFRDITNQDRLYVRKAALERFRIDPIGEEVRIDGTACYEINVQDANSIRANTNNSYSPYIVSEKYAKVVIPEKKEEATQSRGLTDKVTIFRNIDNQEKLYVRKAALERFRIDPIGEEVRIDGAACYEINVQDANSIRANTNNSYSPYIVSEKYAKVVIPEKKVDYSDSKGLTDKVSIFRDINNQEHLYVRKPSLERFNIEPIGEEVRIDGTACYEISVQDANNIRANTNNSYSPYIVDERYAKVVIPEKKVDYSDSKGLTDKVSIFRDIDNQDHLYVRKAALERFNIEPIEEEVRIEGAACYEISVADANSIRANTNNSYSPYIVEEKLAKVVRKEKEVELKQDAVQSSGLTDRITIFRDQNNPDKLYARKPVFTRFNIEPIGEGVRCEGTLCFEISVQDANTIRANAHNSYSPYIVVEKTVEVKEDKKETTSMVVYTPQHIQVADDFKKEVQEGNIEYNVMHHVPKNARIIRDKEDENEMDTMMEELDQKQEEENYARTR